MSNSRLDVTDDLSAPRLMRDPQFRQAQWDTRYAEHVAPLNRYVDELGTHDAAGSPPYIAPMYYGVNARALLVSRDPGPKAGGERGSGFLCIENDDSSAERMWMFARDAGVDVRHLIPWNAYPWYINADPTRAQLEAGLPPLRQVMSLLPDLRVVAFFGLAAHRQARNFIKADPELTTTRAIPILTTYHTSRRALQHPDPAVRESRSQQIADTLRQISQLVGA